MYLYISSLERRGDGGKKKCIRRLYLIATLFSKKNKRTLPARHSRRRGGGQCAFNLRLDRFFFFYPRFSVQKTRRRRRKKGDTRENDIGPARREGIDGKPSRSASAIDGDDDDDDAWEIIYVHPPKETYPRSFSGGTELYDTFDQLVELCYTRRCCHPARRGMTMF